MPTVYSAVPEVETHIIRPISNQMAHKLVNDLDLSSIIRDNIFIDVGTTAVQRTSEQNHKTPIRLNQFRVQTDVVLNPASVKWDILNTIIHQGPGFLEARFNRDFVAIFADMESNIFVSEALLPTHLAMQCTIALGDRTQAYNLPSMIYRRTAPGTVFSETLSFDYPIPKDILTLLFSMYKLKKLSKYISFKDYMRMCTMDYVSLQTNRTLTKTELVASRISVNAHVSFDYTDTKPNEIKSNKSTDLYESTFTCYLQFNRPDTLMLRYPPVIDNTLVPEEMIPSVKNKSVDILPSLDGPAQPQVMEDWVRTVLKFKPHMQRFPFYDDWDTPLNSVIIKRSYWPFISAIFLIEAEEGVTELNLNEPMSDDYELHPIVKEILQLQGSGSLDPDCIFNISIFTNDIMLDPSCITFDTDLKLTVTTNNVHRIKRMVISQITDLQYLNPKYQEILDKYTDTSKESFIDPSTLVDKGETHVHPPLRILETGLIARREINTNR